MRCYKRGLTKSHYINDNHLHLRARSCIVSTALINSLFSQPISWGSDRCSQSFFMKSLGQRYNGHAVVAPFLIGILGQIE